MYMEKIFGNYLKKASFLSWGIKLVNIPITVVVAKLTSLVVSEATKGNIENVLWNGAALLAIVVGAKIFNILTEIIFQKIQVTSKHNCKMELYHKFFNSPLHILYKSKHGDVLEKFNQDFDTMTGRYLTLYPEFWTCIITVLVYFGIICNQQAGIAFLILFISFLQILPSVVVKKYLQMNYEENREVEAKLTEFICSGYRGFETIKLYGLKPWFLNVLKELHQQELRAGNKSEATFTLEMALGEFIDKVVTYGSYIIVGLFVLYKMTSLEIAVQVIALAPGLFGAVKTIFSQFPRLIETKAAGKRLSPWFMETSEVETMIENEQILLSDVSFSYEDKKILEHVSAKINMNQTYVLKGANGIGKSSLFHLLTGLTKCQNGTITIGTANSHSLSEKNFPGKLFYLPQEDAEFDFAPNELYQMILGKKLDLVYEIAKSFGLRDDLFFESKISELSGGERKKVFLSLALALNPQILLLDEPTNSLDESGKYRLKQLLKERMGGALIITHENCFDEIADHIYVLENGGLKCEEIR